MTRIFLVLFFISIIFSTAYTQDDKSITPTLPTTVSKDIKDDDLNAEQIIEQNKEALVSIWYHSDSYFSYWYSYQLVDTTLISGSGFIFDKNGYVGTNNHVVSGFDSLFVKTSDGTFYNAELVFIDEKNDIAILKILNANKEFPVVKIGNSDLPKVGQSVYAIGSPLGFEYTISEGIIAAIRENEKVSFSDPITFEMREKTFDKVIQITAPISPGNSGGALFNSSGEVIGITTYSYGFYGNLNFATGINSLSKLINTIDFATIDYNTDFINKKRENLFASNLRLAENFKSRTVMNWFYTKQRDTMKVYDSVIVKQDSLNKIYFQKTLGYYNICLDIKPDSFYVYESIIDLYIQTENFNLAEDFFSKTKEKFSSDSLMNSLSSSFAQAYNTSKDYKKALVFYEKMYKKDTSDIYLLFQIGEMQQKLNDFKSAENTYNKIISINPNYINGYLQLVKINYERDDLKKAKKFLKLSLEKSFLEESAYNYYVDIPYYRGLIAVKEGNKLEAMLAYIDLKSISTYTKEETDKKYTLYKSILKMEE